MREIAGPLRTYLKRLRFGAVLMVPLIADGTYLGNLSLGREGRQRPFMVTDITDRIHNRELGERLACPIRLARVPWHG